MENYPVSNRGSVGISMTEAETIAVMAADKDIIGKYGDDRGWHFDTQSVRLESLQFGEQSLLLYRVILQLNRPKEFLRAAIQNIVEYQVEAITGKIVGYEKR